MKSLRSAKAILNLQRNASLKTKNIPALKESGAHHRERRLDFIRNAN